MFPVNIIEPFNVVDVGKINDHLQYLIAVAARRLQRLRQLSKVSVICCSGVPVSMLPSARTGPWAVNSMPPPRVAQKRLADVRQPGLYDLAHVSGFRSGQVGEAARHRRRTTHPEW